MLTISSQDNEQRGAKVLIAGPPGIGKTTLLRTALLASTLFVDIEAGDLAVLGLAVDKIKPNTWLECQELTAAIGNGELAKYDTFFIDSLTAISRLSFEHARRQSGRDLRAAYGEHARQLLAWLIQLQQIRAANVTLVAILERAVDDFGVVEHRLQLEGLRTGRELPGIIDEVITMNWVSFSDGKPTRAFVCTAPNPWSYPAKDRSGRLEQFEPPDLGKLIHKLTRPSAAASDDVSMSAVKG